MEQTAPVVRVHPLISDLFFNHERPREAEVWAALTKDEALGESDHRRAITEDATEFLGEFAPILVQVPTVDSLVADFFGRL